MGFENADGLKRFLLERFGIVLPPAMELTKTKAHGIRVHAKNLKRKTVFGLKGFMAYSKKGGINPYFIQLVGHLAKKNIIAVNFEDAKKYAAAKKLKKNIRSERGEVIIVYRGHVLGLGIHEGNGNIACPLKEKRRREIINDINTYPGRVF